jgi:hypothetical protein
MKMLCLKKKMRIEKADKAKIQKALQVDHRFVLLNNLQSELNKLIKKHPHNDDR